jgi:16S rRNA G966 N2-methylase RsmD
MCQLIRANLELCGVPTEQAQVVQAEAVDFVRRAIRDRPPPSDLVFFDPPYDSSYVDVLKVLSEAPHLFSENAVLIVEHYHKKDLPDQLGTMIRKRVLKQGDPSLSFYYQDDTSLLPAS